MSRVWLFLLCVFAILQHVTVAIDFGPFGDNTKARLVESEQQNLYDGAAKANLVLTLSEKGKHDGASSAADAAVEHLRAASLDAAALKKLGDRNATYRQATEVQFAARLAKIATEQRNLAAAVAAGLGTTSTHDKTKENKTKTYHKPKEVNFEHQVAEPDDAINVDDVKSDVDRVFWPKDPKKFLSSLTSAASRNIRKNNLVKVNKAKQDYSGARSSTTIPILPFKNGDIIVAVEAYPSIRPSKFFYGKHEKSQLEGWFPAALVEEYVTDS